MIRCQSLKATCFALSMAASTLTSCVDWYALKMSGCSAASQGRTFLSPRLCGVCRRTSTPLGSMFSFASFGQGPVGLSATQLAVEMGARVIAIDIAPERRKLAQQFGAAEGPLVSRSQPDPPPYTF